MKEENKIIQCLLNRENSCQIKVKNMIVEMEYSNDNKTFNECLLNILKRKIGK